MLLEGAKQVNPSVKESAQKDLSKIKFSITKEKLAVKPKQEKPSLNPQDNLASNSHVEDKVEVECTTSTVGKNDTNKALTNEVGNNYQGVRLCLMFKGGVNFFCFGFYAIFYLCSVKNLY